MQISNETHTDYYEKIVIALAGALQAAALVKEIAQTGKASEKAFQANIYSIFQKDPDHQGSVFGGLSNLQLGLEKVLSQFNPHPDTLLTRYLLSIIHLQKKLTRSPKLLQQMSERLNRIKKQVDFFSLTHPLVVSNLADTYSTLLGKSNFKIIIWGNQRILNVGENMEKIRALLLSGMRAVSLWRQAGGSRFQFLFARAKIKNAANNLLKLTSVMDASFKN